MFLPQGCQTCCCLRVFGIGADAAKQCEGPPFDGHCAASVGNIQWHGVIIAKARVLKTATCLM
eukprot:12455246-Alexandrium_andersonii.AAC.1